MGRLLHTRNILLRPEMGRQPTKRGPIDRPARHGGLQHDPRPFGLGDAVEVVAKPIAIWIDRHHRTVAVLGLVVRLAVCAGWVTLPLAGCSACSRRRRALNVWLPDLRSWAAWGALCRRLAGFRHRPGAVPEPQ